jgi:glycine reductase
MNTKKLKIIHYVNQFFGQEGGEEKADMRFLVKEGPIGPGLALQKILGDRGGVVATLVCGDNYFAEHIDTATEEGFKLISPYEPDLLFAGPAFEAGRYGVSCGAICKKVHDELGIPALTGMYEENPGVDIYRKDIQICKTDRSAAKMVQDLTNMVNLGLKLLSDEEDSRLVSGENLGRPSEYGYFPRGIVRNEFVDRTAAERMIDMIVAKLEGKPFVSEAQMPKPVDITPASPIKEMGSAEIALISDGGLVPKGNPDGFKMRANLVWAGYDIEKLFPDGPGRGEFEIMHPGYYAVHVLDDPNRLVPVDVMRNLEREGVIGRLHPLFYSTTGNAGIHKRCQEMGQEIAEELKEKGVQGALLTST